MRPSREEIRSSDYSYFISTQTYGRRSLFQVEKYAGLMVDVLKHYDGTGYILHAFVVMRDHLHVLLTPSETVEKSVQLIKGGFSFRAKRELGMNGEVWQPGFTDHRIRDSEDWDRHLRYVGMDPVEARLVADSVLYEWIGFPNIKFPQGLKPSGTAAVDVRAEARTLHPNEQIFLESGTAEAAPFQSKNGDVASAGTGAVPVQSKCRSVESFADLRDKGSG